MTKSRQTFIGLILALLILSGWLYIYTYGIFIYKITPSNLWLTIPMIILEVWLSAGMFIVAHDAIHGSLSPSMPSLNKWLGRVCLALYAFFPYDAVASKHYAHHRYAGREGDPDFNPDDPHAFWPWYWKFFTQYFTIWQIIAISSLVVLYVLLLHAPVANIIVFWALPAIASSFQLFTFGTWLPHRHEASSFVDRHNARSLPYGWLASLAACFHFGYHIEHHRSPHSPWWALPKVRADRLVSDTQG